MTIIELDDVSVRYGTGDETVTAVDGLSLSIAKGELVCLLGPSGCGKSTALKVIAGLRKPDAGHLKVDEAVTASKPDRVMVWQQATLMRWRTILRNVEFPLELHGVPREERKKLALKSLAAMGIDDFAEKHPHELSGGMKQRAGIARALVGDPQVLLMDEPFAALDAQTRRLLQEQLLALWNDLDKTIVFVTHSVEEAILLGDRIVVMTARPGRVKDVVQVPFERPRGMDIRHTEQYHELEERIWSLLHVEAERAELTA